MPLEYYTERPTVNTGATQRLALTHAAPALFPYVCLCVGAILFVLWLAHLPQPAPPVPQGYSYYADNRTCIGIAIDCH